MVAIKRQKLKAYILLESLFTLAVFTLVTSLLLSAINQGRQQQIQEELSLNGVQVRLVRDSQQIRVYHENKEILHVKKD